MINKILTLLDKFSTHLDNVFFPKKSRYAQGNTQFRVSISTFSIREIECGTKR